MYMSRIYQPIVLFFLNMNNDEWLFCEIIKKKIDGMYSSYK